MSQGNPTDKEIEVYSTAIVLDGMTQSDAWRKTFPKSKAKDESVHVNASKLNDKPKVQLRILQKQNEFKERAEEEFSLTTSALQKTLSDVMEKGLSEKEDAQGNLVSQNLGAVVSAVAEVNRMNGNHAPTGVDLSNKDGSLTPTVIERRIIDVNDNPSD
jgi:hypothetical protein